MREEVKERRSGRSEWEENNKEGGQKGVEGKSIKRRKVRGREGRTGIEKKREGGQ